MRHSMMFTLRILCSKTAQTHLGLFTHDREHKIKQQSCMTEQIFKKLANSNIISLTI